MHASSHAPAPSGHRQAATGWLLAGFLAAAPGAGAGVHDLTAEFVAPAGMEVLLWADSPLLLNPTSIDIDARGRVWVAEAVNYRAFRGPDINQPAAEKLRHPGGDRIMILEDTDGDGACDNSKVFVQDPDLVAPLGVAVLGNRVVVSCSPNLLVYVDEDGDDRPDRREVLLTGFGGLDHDHGLHSLVGGPDGRWYFNVGNAGPHLVADRAGWMLRSGSFYVGGSPHNNRNTPGLRSDDGRVWTGGLALRVDPEGTGLAVLAHNFRNSYEVAIDSFGDLWQNDNDDEVQSCRTSWILPGGNMGFFSADGSRSWRADRRPGQSVQVAQWHQEDPGVAPAGDIYGAGGPTGVAVYEAGLLPERYRGAVLNADAGRNTIFAHIPRAAGAGFQLERSIFLSSRRDQTESYVWNKVSADRSWLFRPSDVAIGPDGAIYVADWFDPLVGGHAMHDNEARGRILRVAPKGRRGRAPSLGLATSAGRAAALASPAIHTRWLGAEALRGRGAAAVPELQQLWRSGDLWVRARVLWIAGALGPSGQELVGEGLRASEPQLRVTAFRVLRQSGSGMLEEARRLADDASLAVRREVLVAMRDVPYADCREIVLAAVRGVSLDRWLVEAAGLAAEGKEDLLYADVRQAWSGEDAGAWSQDMADLAWRLHPLAAVPDLVLRALRSDLPVAARRKALDALAFVKHPLAAEAMERVAREADGEVRAAASWWSAFRAGNDWASFAEAAGQTLGSRRPEDRERAGKLARWRAAVLDTGQGRAEREAALESLAATPEGGAWVIELAAGGKLPDELKEAAAESIFRNPDLGIRALASQYFQRQGRGGRALPPAGELARMAGDVGRGRAVFFGEAAACSRCHRFGEEGADVGPDLSQVRTKYNREGLLDAILNPSAAIAFGYEAWLVTMADGEVYSGFIVAEGASVILKQASGEQLALPAAKVASRRRQALSLMPDNAALGLSAQELSDLVEFLGAGPGARR